MKVDVAIIGNGILGATTALQLSLSDPAITVALIGRPGRPQAASVAAGAMLNLFAELEPGVFDNEHSLAKFNLGRVAAAKWPDHVEWLNALVEPADRCELKFGSFIVNNARADAFDDKSYEAVVSALQRYDEPFESCNPREIVGYHPSARGRALRAIFLPNEGYIPSRKLFRTLDAAIARRTNLHRIDQGAARVNVAAGRVRSVELDSGEEVPADRVVIANGAFAQQLIDQLPELKSRIPRLFFGVGTGVVLRPPELPTAVIRTNNRGLACGLHSVPDAAEGTLYVGASNFISTIPEPFPRLTSLNTLLNEAVEELNTSFYKARVEEVRVGYRPTTADLFPLIGPTSVAGLLLLTGTKRDGFFMSPVYCPEVVRALQEGTPCFDGRFKPERRLISTMTRDEGITKAVAHLWSGAYQHQLAMPHAGWEPQIEEMLRQKVLDAYARAGDPDYGIPAEMLDMYRYGHARQTEA